MIPLGRSSEISWSLQLHLLCIVIYFSAEASDELPVHKRGCKKHREEPAELMQSLVSRSSPNSSSQAHEQSCLGDVYFSGSPGAFGVVTTVLIALCCQPLLKSFPSPQPYKH